MIRAKERAGVRGISLSALIEEALALAHDQPLPTKQVKPVTLRGKGLSREFEGASWVKVRDAIYS